MPFSCSHPCPFNEPLTATKLLDKLYLVFKVRQWMFDAVVVYNLIVCLLCFFHIQFRLSFRENKVPQIIKCLTFVVFHMKYLSRISVDHSKWTTDVIGIILFDIRKINIVSSNDITHEKQTINQTKQIYWMNQFQTHNYL